ncbi:tyrosine-type recombinase/integrase [Rhodococcus opacus]|uniref:tyrosine-type recombinase/integrase n=3 Tax=Rhodococcus opacus TaxID=37919 RepID=UPI0007CD6B06|nr:tyrosine-type recombinase/integrase [Rhodococcus opacus]MDV6246715.1 tyrosine-type recombinase/integrase [Rhodococcus opacus]NKY76758.1 tyrosine-type recombinase/integrase [Rhodococcus opacus]
MTTMRAFPVQMPSGTRYWTVIDEDLLVMSVADAYLRYVRFGRDGAESTTKSYAGAVALYLSWCAATGQDWRAAAGKMPSFVLWLRHSPSQPEGATAGEAGTIMVRGPRRINCVLAGVRGFLAFAVDHGHTPRGVLGQLYELADSQDLPAEARGEDGAWRLRMRARHRVPIVRQRPGRASDEDVLLLLRACLSARDRLLVLLLARAGLRRGEVVGLRREDVHFLLDSSALGCSFPGSHLHVVRRQNTNGAWAKSRHSRIVPVDSLVVQAHDQYVAERATKATAWESDFVFVNLFRAPIGAPMTPGAVNALLAAASRRAGLDRAVHPHALRHGFASNVLDAGGSIDEVQELLGHASISSSQVYVHPAPERLRAAVERVGRAVSRGDTEDVTR